MLPLWDTTTNEELDVLRGHKDHVPSLAFSPDGKRIVTASWDNTVRLWDASTGEELSVLRWKGNDVRSVAFSPDGARLASGSSERTARFWDTMPYRVRRAERQAILAAAPQAERIVTALWSQLNEPRAVARRLREDASLGAEVRRAALNEVLRRSVAQRAAAIEAEEGQGIR